MYRERRSLRNGDEMLPADALAACLDAAFVVADGRPREARLEEVVVGQCREARRQLAVASRQHLRDSGLQVIVRGRVQHTAATALRSAQ